MEKVLYLEFSVLEMRPAYCNVFSLEFDRVTAIMLELVVVILLIVAALDI